MVCCCHGSVRVYTKQLKYVRKIGSHGDNPGQFVTCVQITCISAIKSCVPIFNNGGEFLCSVMEMV